MDDLFAKRLRNIAWFSRCGRPFDVPFPLETSTVSGWVEAMRLCSDPAWENLTLEVRNQLTDHLFADRNSSDQNWNAVAQRAREDIVLPLEDDTWVPFSKSLGLDRTFVDCVVWDIIHAVMEHEYRGSSGRPIFFLHLLQVYEAGHFPCGWLGEWPKGKLVVL